MKKLSVLCTIFCIGLPATAFARGGMGSHHAYMAGEAFHTPGTNSLGTALSSSGVANGQTTGPLLGTNPTIDREDAQVDKMVKSICRGC
jgi:hypothetical protein